MWKNGREVCSLVTYIHKLTNKDIRQEPVA